MKLFARVFREWMILCHKFLGVLQDSLVRNKNPVEQSGGYLSQSIILTFLSSTEIRDGFCSTLNVRCIASVANRSFSDNVCDFLRLMLGQRGLQSATCGILWISCGNYLFVIQKKINKSGQYQCSIKNESILNVFWICTMVKFKYL